MGLGLRIVVDQRGGPWVSGDGDQRVLVGFRVEISWVSNGGN